MQLQSITVFQPSALYLVPFQEYLEMSLTEMWGVKCISILYVSFYFILYVSIHKIENAFFKKILKSFLKFSPLIQTQLILDT